MSDRRSLWDRRTLARQIIAAGAAVVAMACGEPSQAGGDPAPPRPGAEATAPAPQILVIDHLTPRRDFVGPQPDRFVWSAATGADTYAIGVWNEADRMVWREDGVSGTAIARPAGLEFEPGTYFWQVTGLQQGRAIARSGQGAFVVE